MSIPSVYIFSFLCDFTKKFSATPNVQSQNNQQITVAEVDGLNTPFNTLRVPSSGYGGAIPRRSVISRDSSADSTASIDAAVTATSVASMTTANSVMASMVSKKTCFCGHFTEVRSTLIIGTD